MKTWLFKLTGWKLLRPARAPWGEATDLWTDGDWRWFRHYSAPIGFLCVTPHMVKLDPAPDDAEYHSPQGD